MQALIRAYHRLLPLLFLKTNQGAKIYGMNPAERLATYDAETAQLSERYAGLVEYGKFLCQ
jgi:hypothetical protein